MNFYRRFPGDYARDTSDLNFEQHGAYNLLLDIAYSTEKPLPTDRELIYRMTRAILPYEKAAIDVVIDRFFQKTRWGFTHKRVSEEITVAESRRKHATDAINQRWKRDTPSNTPSNTESNTQTIQSQTPDSRHQTREVFQVEAAEESSTNTVENNGKLPAAAAALISTDEIHQAFDAISTRPFGDENFQVLFALATRNFSGSWTDVMEGTILAAQKANVTVPREFFLIKREVEQIEVKNSFKRPPP